MYVIRMSMLLLALSVLGTACSANSPNLESTRQTGAGDEKALKEAVQNVTVKQMAEQSYDTVMKDYYISKDNLYLENYVRKQDDKMNSYLWPYSTVISAVNALANMPDGGENYQRDLIRVLEGVDKYWQSGGDPPGYAPTLQKGNGGGQKYYDDNEWVGLDLVGAYRTLKDPKYLKRAEEVFRFVISGWSDELGGGIYWREWKQNDPPRTKNTCSNGPAAVLAMKLYEETKDQAYLEWAKKILNWTQKLKSPDHVYWDHINSDGTIDKRTFTYNVGTILQANALLYKTTGEKQYLEEARALASGSYAHFAKQGAGTGVAFYPKTPWFNVVLFRGYSELYRVDPEKNSKYIDAMRSNVVYAWEHARDEKGLFSKDWSGKTGVDEVHKPLLDQAPMIEFYAMLSQYK